MRTTDDIIQSLIDQRAKQLADGVPVDVRAVEQEIIAHKQLARLREQRADAVKAKDFLRVNDIDAQIQHWVRFVSEDVDEKVAADPKKDATKLVEPEPPADAAVKG